MTDTPIYGINRWDFSSPDAFAAHVKRAQGFGWRAAFIPSSPFGMPDPYVMLAAAAREADQMLVGPLIENPVMRHPVVLASSIATLAMVAPGRTVMGFGQGDTAVRFVGKRPATMRQQREAVQMMRRLLAGESLDLGVPRPATLRHARPVPIWIAAGGPKTLRMAGAVCDGVFIRAGTHPDSLRNAVDQVRAGAMDAGRDPSEVKLGAVYHTVFSDDRETEYLVGKSMAAGYYEYSPMLFEPLGLTWDGPSPEQIKERVYPDFHHARDLIEAGREVSFLDDRAADDFSLHGSWDDIRWQLRRLLDLDFGFEVVVTHPVDGRAPGSRGEPLDFHEGFAKNVIQKL